MDQSQSEIATEEDEGAKTETLRSACNTCQRPLVDGPSGTISMWIFDGVYCCCKSDKRSAQILYFDPHSDSGDGEAKALTSLIASQNVASADSKERTPTVFLVKDSGNSKELGPETAKILNSDKPKPSSEQLSMPEAPRPDAPPLATSEAPPLAIFSDKPCVTTDVSPSSCVSPAVTAEALRLVTPDASPVSEEALRLVISDVQDRAALTESTPVSFDPSDIRYPSWDNLVTLDSTDLKSAWGKNHDTSVHMQFSPEVSTNSITREILAAGQIAQSAPETLVGKLIGENYLVIEFIGKGFNGAVFKVNRDGIPGVFALKILLPNIHFTTRQNIRFLAQAKLIKELDHHRVLALYDAGVTDDLCPFIVTDFFGSERLSDALKADGPLEERDAIEVFLQIAEGLIHAHYMGITHRDIKPSNVRIKEEEDGSKVVKLADCGVGKMYPDPNRETRYFTENGMEYGDARYMSPEQYSGAKADHRADIYSFGCLMYEVLTGRPPFVADRVSMMIYKHVRKRVRSVSERFPDLPISPDLDQLILRCLEKLPDNRYQSVSDLRDDLETIKAGKPVRRVFKTHLAQTPIRLKSQIVTPNSTPDMVSLILASWLAFWVGYSASARLAFQIVIFSAAIAFLLFSFMTRFDNHQMQYQLHPTYTIESLPEIRQDYSVRLHSAEPDSASWTALQALRTRKANRSSESLYPGKALQTGTPGARRIYGAPSNNPPVDEASQAVRPSAPVDIYPQVPVHIYRDDSAFDLKSEQQKKLE